MVSRMMNGVSYDIPAELRRLANSCFSANCASVCPRCVEPCAFDLILTAAEIIEEYGRGLPPPATARETEREFFSLLPRLSQLREELEGERPFSSHPEGSA